LLYACFCSGARRAGQQCGVTTVGGSFGTSCGRARSMGSIPHARKVVYGVLGELNRVDPERYLCVRVKRESIGHGLKSKLLNYRSSDSFHHFQLTPPTPFALIDSDGDISKRSSPRLDYLPSPPQRRLANFVSIALKHLATYYYSLEFAPTHNDVRPHPATTQIQA